MEMDLHGMESMELGTILNGNGNEVVITTGDREDARRLALGVYNKQIPHAQSRQALHNRIKTSELVAYLETDVSCLCRRDSSDRGIVPNLLFVSVLFERSRATKVFALRVSPSTQGRQVHTDNEHLREMPSVVNLPGRPQPKPTKR